jgi:hypothetical protein
MGLNVINNTGTNYTLYYNVLDYFKTIMDNHPSLIQVTQGDVFSVDTREFPAYPLGNIIVTNARFSDSVTVYTCQLTVADKVKLKNNESSGSYNEMSVPFEGVDDVVDIHANTLSILNDLLSYTQYGVEGFEMDGNITCDAFKQEYDNGLAGWSANFSIRTHNNRDRCLFDLLPQS